MSEDVLRTYPARPTGARGLRLGRRRRPWVRRAFLVILVGVPLGAWWTTRNTHDMGELVPRDRAYSLIFADLIEGRRQIADSPAWDLLPEGHAYHEYRALLKDDFGLPSWLINNLVSGVVYVSGKDTSTYQDAVLVTRMTRFGTFLERFRGWSEQVRDDDAGGLELRLIPSASLYYAVRGRILLLSRDRTSLIRALVMLPEESIGAEEFAKLLVSNQDALIEARVRTDAAGGIAAYADAAEMRMWLDQDSVRLLLAARLNEAARELYAPILSNATPVALPPPLSGALEVSADLGLPAAESWKALGAALGAELDLPALATGLLEDTVRDAATPILASGLAQLESGWTLSYLGMNPMAFVPMPRLAASFGCNAAWAQSWLRSMPPPAEGVQPWQSWPRYSDEGAYLHLPLMGGPDLEPTLLHRAGRLMLYTSLHDARNSNHAASGIQDSLRGNLLVRCIPSSLFDDFEEAALQFAELGVVRGHSAETLPGALAPWRDAASRIALAQLLLAHDNGIVSADLSVEFKASPAETAPQP